MNKLYYNGKPLVIAFVGQQEFPEIKNVKFVKTDLSTLSSHTNTFDGLIISKESFKTADNNQYVNFYQKASYPIFF